MISGTKSDAHALGQLLSFAKSKFEVLSFKEEHIPVTISVPARTAPGGLYGSVVFEFAPVLSDKTQPAQNIAIKSRVATLFFIRIKGEVHEEGALAAFGLFNNAQTSLSPSSLAPLRFQIAFENKGDVQLSPHGNITLKSMFGKSTRVVVDPWVVLPSATRMREIDVIDKLFPGYYRATLEQARGYGDAIDKSEKGFWILPSPTQGVVGVIVLILLLLLLRRSLAISRNTIS